MQASDVVDVVSKLCIVEEDHSDDVVVAMALDGKADFVFSGDNHLLVVNSFREIKIVSFK